MKLSDLILFVGGCALAYYVFGPIVAFAPGAVTGW